MSSATSVSHDRNSDGFQKAGSQRVTARCIELLRILEPHSVKKRLERLLDGINGKGDDVRFIKRWEYDDKQKEAIIESINNIPE